MRRGNCPVLAAQALGGVILGVRVERDWQLAADQVGVEWSSIAGFGMMGKGAKEQRSWSKLIRTSLENVQWLQKSRGLSRFAPSLCTTTDTHTLLPPSLLR
jgi:hypothetical protein